MHETETSLGRTYLTAKPYFAGGKQYNAFRITIAFLDAGESWRDGHHYPAGYRASFLPIAYENVDGEIFENFKLDGGWYIQLSEDPAFSESRLREYDNTISANLDNWLIAQGLGLLVKIGYHELG